MYSYEAHIRAVEFYVELGKRIVPTIWQMGYSTKNALRGWHVKKPFFIEETDL